MPGPTWCPRFHPEVPLGILFIKQPEWTLYLSEHAPSPLRTLQSFPCPPQGYNPALPTFSAPLPSHSLTPAPLVLFVVSAIKQNSSQINTGVLLCFLQAFFYGLLLEVLSWPSVYLPLSIFLKLTHLGFNYKPGTLLEISHISSLNPQDNTVG